MTIISRAKAAIEADTPLKFSIEPVKSGPQIVKYLIRITEYKPDNKDYDIFTSKRSLSYEKKKAQLDRDFMRMNGDPEFAENKMREFNNRAGYYDSLAERCKKYTEK